MHSIPTALLITQLEHLDKKMPSMKKRSKKEKVFFCLLANPKLHVKNYASRNKLDTSVELANQEAAWQMKPGSTNFCCTTVPALCVSHCHGNALTFMAQLSSKKTSSHSTPFLLQKKNIFPFALSSLQNDADLGVIKY